MYLNSTLKTNFKECISSTYFATILHIFNKPKCYSALHTCRAVEEKFVKNK